MALRLSDGYFQCPALAVIIGTILLLALSGPARAQTPAPSPAPPLAVHLNFGHFSGSPSHIEADNAHLVYGGEMTVDADHLQGDLLAQNYAATGHVRVHEADTTLAAQSLQYDGRRNIGVAAQALLTQWPYTVRARQITVTPSEIEARAATFTTAPPDEKPDYHIRIGTLSLYPERNRAVLRSASFYLYGTRLLTIPHYGFTLGNGANEQARRQEVRPSFGYSGRYGMFLALEGGLGRPLPVPAQYQTIVSMRQALQTRLTSAQPLWRLRAPQVPAPKVAKTDYLGQIRALATAARGPLPEGDPLLFHDFLPDPNPIRLFDAPSGGGLTLGEELSYHMEASGRRRDNLYVTRAPEIMLSGRLPLTREAALPREADSLAFRRYLRQPVIYADAQAVTGYYQEEPDNLHHDRVRSVLGLSMRPLLIAPNTVIFPRLSYISNRYSGTSRTYDLTQAAVAVSRYFSNYSAFGLQYIATSARGDSPFNFDVVDTTGELDIRLQLGNRRFAGAGLVRYDLVHHNAIDYKLSLAPAQHGFTPVFSYNFRNRSFGIGLEIPGVTF